jgi:hypothetical protein
VLIQLLERAASKVRIREAMKMVDPDIELDDDAVEVGRPAGRSKTL